MTPGPWIARRSVDSPWPCWEVVHAGTNTIVAGRIGDRENAESIAALPDLRDVISNVEANLTGRDCFAERVADSLRRLREATAEFVE